MEEIDERSVVKNAMRLEPEFREDPAWISGNEQARAPRTWSRISRPDCAGGLYRRSTRIDMKT